MKARELKDLGTKDLIKKTADLQEELFNLRIQNLSGSLENSSKIRQTRREIARLMTMQNLKNLKH